MATYTSHGIRTAIYCTLKGKCLNELCNFFHNNQFQRNEVCMWYFQFLLLVNNRCVIFTKSFPPWNLNQIQFSITHYRDIDSMRRLQSHMHSRPFSPQIFRIEYISNRIECLRTTQFLLFSSIVFFFIDFRDNIFCTTILDIF